MAVVRGVVIVLIILLVGGLIYKNINNTEDLGSSSQTSVSVPEITDEMKEVGGEILEQEVIDVAPEIIPPVENNNQVINQETNVESMNEQETKTVVMKTSKGDVKIELFTGQMPITTGNFLDLVEKEFYDGILFHRVIPGFMVQVGDPQTKDPAVPEQLYGTSGPGYLIEDEFVEGENLTNVRGTLSMANTGAPNSGGSQLFINVADNTNLDFDKPPFQSKHPVFGKVIEGMDVIDAIANAQTGPRDLPVEAIKIESITIQK